MGKGVVLGLCFGVLASSSAMAEAPAVAGQDQKCLALEVPQKDSGVKVSATYAGQVYEFRVTVDGKPVSLEGQDTPKEIKANCVYTS